VIRKPHLDAWRNRVGRQESEKIMRNAAAFGTKVHSTAVAVANGEAVNGDMAPFAGAISEFYSQCVEEVISTELELVSEQRKFGGTLDAYVRLKGGSLAVCDFKTSANLTRDHNWQTAGYAILLRENGYQVNKRAVVKIDKEKPGEWRVRWCDDHKNDAEGFLNCVALWWSLNRSKMLKLHEEKK
jgi:predicted RecB family nuclease